MLCVDFLVNIFCTYCSNFKRNPSSVLKKRLKLRRFENIQLDTLAIVTTERFLTLIFLAVSPSFCTNSSSSSGIKYCLWANTFSNSHTSIGENVVRCFFFRGRSEIGSDRAASSLSRPLSTSVLGLSESTLGEWSAFCWIWSFKLWPTETEEFEGDKLWQTNFL